LRDALAPRLALGLGTILVWLGLAQGSLGLRVSDPRPAASSPAEIYRGIDAQIQLAYTGGKDFFEDLRLYYRLYRLAQREPQSVSPARSPRNPPQISRMCKTRLADPTPPSSKNDNS